MKRSHSSPLSFLFPGRSPLAILFAIVDGGIEVQLFQNNQLLKDWQPSQLQHILPEPLIRWMENQRIHLGPQPYPLIKQFWQSLIPQVSKKLIVDSSALTQLVEGTQPQDFALVWELNRSLERIEGRYEGADRYLGMGWFQKGAYIWPLKLSSSASLDAHLKNPVYSLQHAAVLLESNISYLEQYLPTRAHFQVITDFVPQVVVHNVSSSAVTLALQCNYPQLLSTISVPRGDFDVLLADRTVIQFPREALTPIMTYLLQSGSAITLEGESIPLFIREQLPIMQRYHQISHDLAAKISQSHPVVSIPTLKPIVSLAHTFENGIGTYNISAIYKYQQHVLDIDALLNAYQRSQHFVRQHGIWFEWSENACGFVNTLLQQRASVPRPEEVMGFDTQRLALLPDQAPACTIKPVGATYVERARSVFTQLRQHGIPGGIVAPHQAGLTIMLETAWEELVRDNPQARILWVVPSKKREAVASVIQSRHVTVASPGTLREEPELVSHAWTLVIFQELDYLLEAEHASEICSKILYVWATFSIASKSALTPAILRILHVPEKYCEQFGAYYLFDPLKGSADIVASNRSAELSRAQKEPRQSEMEKPAASGSIAIPDVFGRSDEVQREKIAQYLEMLKQNRVRRTLSSTAPAIRSFLPSKPKIEQVVSNGSVALPASLRIHDERNPDLTIARKAFLTVLGEHISSLNVAHKVFLNLIDKRVSALNTARGSAEIQQGTVAASGLHSSHAQTPPTQGQSDSQIVAHNLFNPLKGYTDVVAGNRSAELSRAQKESKQSERVVASPPSPSQPEAIGSKYEAQREKLLQHFEMLRQSRVQRASAETSSKPKESTPPERATTSPSSKAERPATSDRVSLEVEMAGRKYEAQQEKLLQHFEMLRQSPVRYPSAELNKVPKESKPLEEETALPSSEPKESRPVATNSIPVEPGAVGRQYEAQQEKLLQHFEMLKRSQAQHVSSSPAAPVTGASRTTGGYDSATSHSGEPRPVSSPKSHSIELNQHTIVRLQQESEQLRERLTVEDEEGHVPSSSATQQNADTSGGSRDLPRAEANPVPENAVPHEKVTVRPDIKQGQKNEPALPATRTEALSFWDQARQWKDRSHGPVPLEKFKHYHPDYTLMNTSQLNWYFYWRSEVRSGRYPATDVGYIFIHAYEALGCIGFTNPTQACDRLFSLWKHYRESFSDLDKYLVPWIADFCVVHTLPLTPMQWYTQVLVAPDCDIDAPLIAEAWLRQGGDWAQIPTAVLYKLVGFNTQKKFYQKMRQKYALDDGYKRAIAAVDNYLSSKFDRPALITRYGKGKLQAVEREPFKWALVEKPYAPITVAHINAAFTDAGFLQALSGILKYADHVQRKLYQNAVSPFAPTIDINWQEAIEAALTKQVTAQADEEKAQTAPKKELSAKQVTAQADEEKMPVAPKSELPARSAKPQGKNTPAKLVVQQRSMTHNTDSSQTGSRQQSTSKACIEERVAVLKQYWRCFDEVHASQTEGMPPLHGSPILNPLSIGFEHYYRFDKSNPYPLYQRHLPARLLSKIERLWGTTMLPLWPDRIVSEPLPHEMLIKTFGVALSFWHSCALNVWSFCEGTLYLDDLGELEDFYRKEIQLLANMGMPINRRLFGELRKASRKLVISQSAEHRAPRGSFEEMRDIISSFRRIWADAYLDKYLKVRWEADLRKVEILYSASVDKRSGIPPTIKQFARDAKNATNYWFGGDIGKMYEAIEVPAPLQPQRINHLPVDKLNFALAVFNTLKEGVLKSQQVTPNSLVMNRRDYQLNKLAEASFWYIQMEEALGHSLALSDFDTSKFTSNSEVLHHSRQKAWTIFVHAIEAAKKALQVSEEVRKPVEAAYEQVIATPVLLQVSNKVAAESKAQNRVLPIQPIVQLNTEAISKLQAESDQLQGRLTLEEVEERQEQSPQNISLAEGEPVAPVMYTISISELEVDEGWKGIAQQWGPEHWEVIRLLHQGKQTDLTSVERRVHRPVSRLIDEVNSPVEEVLGDLLIDPDTRMIADHLQATLEVLLGWYRASKEK